MEKNSFTIKNIAEMAGVSIGTVDRVLHNRGNVSRKSLEKVNAVLSSIDYKPCAFAKALSGRRKNIVIGVTYPEMDCAFWKEVKVGIDKARKILDPYGVVLEVITTSSYSAESQKQTIKEIVEKGVSGIILCAVENFSLKGVDDDIPENIPFATVINKITSPRVLFHLGPDDIKMGELAALLVNQYSENSTANTVIISSNGQFMGSQLRIAGFISKATEEFRKIIITQTILADGDVDSELDDDIYAKVTETLRKYPNTNAFYIMNGLIKGAAEAIRDAHRNDIVLVAHEDVPELKEYLESGLVKATIYQHPAKQIFQGIMLLCKYLLEGEHVDPVIVTESSIMLKENYSSIQKAERDFLYI